MLPAASVRSLACALAVFAGAALTATGFHVVASANGPWGGLTDPPQAARLAIAGLAAALAGETVRRWPQLFLPVFATAIAALPLLPAASGRLLALLAFQGPMLVILGTGLIALAVERILHDRSTTPAPSDPRRDVTLGIPTDPALDHRRMPLLIFVLTLAGYAVLGAFVPGPAGPQGDEPHYLLMAESLWKDGDLDLANQFAAAAYAPFYAGVLEAHTSPASPRGTIYPVHTPGLPALLLPAYAAGGYPAARFAMSVMAALVGVLVYRLVIDVFRGPRLALAASALVVATPPLPFYAVAIYPETPAALACAVFLLTSRRDPTRWSACVAAVTAAVLPWLHPKLLPLAVVGLASTLARRFTWRGRLLTALPLAVSVAGLLAFFHAHYGHASIAAAYGPGFGADVSASRIPWGAFGLVFDRQFGLLATGPVWLLAGLGMVALWRQRTGDALRALGLGGATFLVGAAFSMWWGGACPPARFVVPALPALALFTAAALPRLPRVVALLGGIGLGIVFAAARAPRALHNRGDGESALLRYVAPALDLDSFLPSFVVGDWRAPVLAVTLVAAACLAVAWGRRGLLLGTLACAATASSLRSGPLLDPGRATQRLLEAWDADNVVTLRGELALSALAVPIELPDRPWTVPSGDILHSRRLDLPAGLYSFEIDGRILQSEAGARAARLDLVAGELLVARTYLRDGHVTSPVGVMLPMGVRRLQMTAVGIQGTSVVAAARLRPIQPVRRRDREWLRWPRIADAAHYRVAIETSGSADSTRDFAADTPRVTSLDRSEPEAGGVRVDAVGSFIVETPEGWTVTARVVRERPNAADVLRWGDRLVPLGIAREKTVTLAGERSVTLGATRLTALRLEAQGSWIGFSGSPGGTSATDTMSASPPPRPIVTTTSPPPESGK